MKSLNELPFARLAGLIVLVVGLVANDSNKILLGLGTVALAACFNSIAKTLP